MRVIECLNTQMIEEAISPIDRETKGLISTDLLPKFEHVDVQTVEEAISLLRTYGERATVIAGGTDLLRELKGRVYPIQPQIVINIKTISKPKLNYIVEDSTGLRIGALTTLHNIETCELLKEKYSILAKAAHMAGVLQHRNMATVGGDLCQHVRCWYYRASGNAFFCYRKGGNKCYALHGDNRFHAILGGEDCLAVCPSETAPALVALDAKVKISGISGDRIASLGEFFRPLENILRPDEILTEIQVPTPEPDSRSTFIKVGLGNEFGSALASVAVVVTMGNKVFRSIKIVLGGVSSIPWRAIRAEEMLAGERINKDRVVEGAARAAIKAATPFPMNEYKLDVVQTLLKRAIMGIL